MKVRETNEEGRSEIHSGDHMRRGRGRGREVLDGPGQQWEWGVGEVTSTTTNPANMQASLTSINHTGPTES